MIIVYGLLAFIVSLISAMPKKQLMNNKYNNTIIFIVIVLLLSISVLNIKVIDFPDTLNYIQSFNKVRIANFNSLLVNEDPLFYILQWIIGKFTNSFYVFYLVVWLIILLNFYKAINNLFPTNFNLFVMFSYFTYFIFFDYVLNVIRQGLAISFLMISVSYLIKRNNNSKLKVIFPSIVAFFFHSSAVVITIYVILLLFFDLKLKWIMYAWGLGSILFFTGLNSIIFSRFNLKSLDTYTAEFVTSYSKVNRIDFYLFSLFFLVISLLIWKYVFNKENDEYLILIKCYALFNLYFILFSFIGFSDRLAAYSWMLIPLLIWKSIPNTKHEQLKTFVVTSLSVLMIPLADALQTLINIR